MSTHDFPTESARGYINNIAEHIHNNFRLRIHVGKTRCFSFNPAGSAAVCETTFAPVNFMENSVRVAQSV